MALRGGFGLCGQWQLEEGTRMGTSAPELPVHVVMRCWSCCWLSHSPGQASALKIPLHPLVCLPGPLSSIRRPHFLMGDAGLSPRQQQQPQGPLVLQPPQAPCGALWDLPGFPIFFSPFHHGGTLERLLFTAAVPRSATAHPSFIFVSTSPGLR